MWRWRNSVQGRTLPVEAWERALGEDRKRRSTALREGRAPTGAATMIETVM
jgi:hypothetical protein